MTTGLLTEITTPHGWIPEFLRSMIHQFLYSMGIWALVSAVIVAVCFAIIWMAIKFEPEEPDSWVEFWYVWSEV